MIYIEPYLPSALKNLQQHFLIGNLPQNKSVKVYSRLIIQFYLKASGFA